MSVEIIYDHRKEYQDHLRTHLREYNSRFINNGYSSNEYFYAYRGDHLEGSIKCSLFWDWVGLNDIEYSDIEVLSSLISSIRGFYVDKAVGIKTYVETISLFDDFLEIGFEHGGTSSSTPLIHSSYYLRSTDFEVAGNSSINVVIRNECQAKDTSLIHSDESTSDIQESEDFEIMIVALDNGTFIGGVKGVVSKDSMYISQIVVCEEYRSRGIGRELMKRIETEAKQMNLYSLTLGTLDFQALDFYKKLGFNIDFIKDNDPKGFKSYSMSKKLIYNI